MPTRMVWKPFWALLFLAWLTILACHAREAACHPSKIDIFCSTCRNNTLPPTIQASDASPSFAFRSWSEKPARQSPLSFLSPQVFAFPATSTVQYMTKLHDGRALLFAKLSFLSAPAPVSVGDLDPSEDQGTESKGRCLRPMYVEANARYLRLSPIKTRRVVHELRGKSLAAALAHLASSPRRPALAIFRAIESALANAVHLHGHKNIKPKLVSVTANNGPVMKRPFFRARGQVNIWRRPTTHIKVVIKAL